MKQIELDCPSNSWPQDFKGNVALGIGGTKDNKSLWLLFGVKNGSVADVHALLVEGSDMPMEIQLENPIIHAFAEKSIWELIVSDKEAFYQKVSKAKVHIGGDFREFGRLTGKLIHLTEQSGLWLKVEEIADCLTE